MAINKKLIHFKNKEKFEQELAKGNILPTSIVFIKNTQEIWTHGQYYSSLEDYYTKTEIDDKNSNLENKLSQIFDDIYRIIGLPAPYFIITCNVTKTMPIIINGTEDNTLYVDVEANVPKRVELKEKLTNMNYMFSYPETDGLPIRDEYTHIDLGNLDTSDVTNMFAMFEGCYSLKSLNLRGLDTGKVTGMIYMFRQCFSLESIDLSSFDTSNVKSMSHMFADCTSLKSLDLSNFDTSKVINAEGMFQDCTNLESLDLSNFNLSNISNLSYASIIFRGCDSLIHIKCKQAFKDWCITNATKIALPEAMREGGSGTWEIVP